MTESWLAGLRDEYAALSARLDAIPAGAERQIIKRDIVAYFKRVDGALGEVTALKEQIRELVERYKQLAADAEGGEAPPVFRCPTSPAGGSSGCVHLY